MPSQKMTIIERRCTISLSAIMGLRMIGLFMVLPLFSPYAQQLTGATPTLIGLAVGIYGLTQALFQIPLGTLSDHIGRKPIILMGLFIFITGSLLAALAHSIRFMIVARALQGAGAIGSTLLALMADMTREEQRSKVMAIAGITIGFSFSVAMLLGPLLIKWMPMNELFLLAAGFGSLAMIILYIWVPTPVKPRWHRDTEPAFASFLQLLIEPALAKLNVGIFILHAIFTASFIVIPVSLSRFVQLPVQHQWLLYLPTLLGALIVSFTLMGLAERKKQLKLYFLSGIIMLITAEGLLWIAPITLASMTISLLLFFAGFSLLEAFLPSLISRTAPIACKGSALGIYSCAQFLGIFVGGALGGWLYGQFNLSSVYLFCILLASIWLILALFMSPPKESHTQLWQLDRSSPHQWDAITVKLKQMPGIIEIMLIPEEGIAYIKTEQSTLHDPGFIQLKNALQSKSFS